MGQRLNIEIIENDKVLANSYYHWSGYTSSSLKLASTILSGIENVKHENGTVRAVKLLELTGAGLTSSELSKLDESIKNDGFIQATDRNSGLIAISDEGIKETKDWEEARVEIHLDTEMVKLDLYWTFKEENYEEAPVFYTSDLNYKEVSFKDFDELKNEILQHIDNEEYYVIANGEKLVFKE